VRGQPLLVYDALPMPSIKLKLCAWAHPSMMHLILIRIVSPDDVLLKESDVNPVDVTVQDVVEEPLTRISF
jgi:hypothetical protein